MTKQTSSEEKRIAQILKELETEIVYKGYMKQQLSAAFDAVCDPKDWKGPIAAWIRGEDIDVTMAAIEFFTATQPSLGYSAARSMWAIGSQGYRAGPAGDH